MKLSVAIQHSVGQQVRGHGESQGICKETAVDYPDRLAEVTDDNQEELQDRVCEHFCSATTVLS